MTLKDIVATRSKAGSSHNSLAHLQQQVGDVFDRFFSDWDVFSSAPYGIHFPAVNVVEEEKDIRIEAELPGMKEKHIKIEARKNQIIIHGERKSETEKKDKERRGTYYLREISYGAFSRTIALPFEPDTHKIDASFSDGMLTVVIKKPEEGIAQSQAIPISSK
jgi:HSP20 family protein